MLLLLCCVQQILRGLQETFITKMGSFSTSAMISIRTFMPFVVSFAIAAVLLSPHQAEAARPVKDDICSKERISIAQSQVKEQPNGIPTFLVEISNTFPKPIGNIHLSCGQFSSAILINSKVFKRVAVNDCLVNDGQPLATGSVLSFTYATTQQWPLSVSSVSCP